MAIMLFQWKFEHNFNSLHITILTRSHLIWCFNLVVATSGLCMRFTKILWINSLRIYEKVTFMRGSASTAIVYQNLLKTRTKRVNRIPGCHIITFDILWVHKSISHGRFFSYSSLHRFLNFELTQKAVYFSLNTTTVWKILININLFRIF